MVAEMIKKYLPNAKLKYVEGGFDKRNYKVNFEKVRDHFGFDIEWDIEAGIKELILNLQKGMYSNLDKNKNEFGNYFLEEKLNDFIPLLTPCNRKRKKYLNECIDSTYVSSAGKFIEGFEDKIKQITKANYVTTLNSGTSALHLSLLDAGVKRDDLVITSDYTFIATANAIKYCGADPVLIDVDPCSFNINFELVDKFIETECEFINGEYIHKVSKRRVSAFLPIMALGNMIDPKAFDSFKSKHSLPIVLDAAAGIGSCTAVKKLGELSFDYATLSFNGNKTITCGAGGAVLTSNDNSRLKHLAATARKHPTYHHDQVGYNYRMTNIGAAIGLAQIELIDDIKAKKIIFMIFIRRV